MVLCGAIRSGRLGKPSFGGVRCAEVRQDWLRCVAAGKLGLGSFRSVTARQGMAGMVGLGWQGQSLAVYGWLWQARRGESWLDWFGYGLVRQAWCAVVCPGRLGIGLFGQAR